MKNWMNRMDIKGLHTPVKMAGFVKKENEIKINHVRTPSITDYTAEVKNNQTS